jgi:phosphoribosylformylglycinamidine synthase subunit PurQ / glutaminase
MAKVKVLVLRAAGTNCDKETLFAFEQAGATGDPVHINRLRETPSLLNDYQILVIPGGFSYGDDISAGKIFAVRLRHELGDRLAEFVQGDKLVLGICNGFQVLVKTGLLPEPELKGEFSQKVTLSDNDSGKYEDRWVWLKSYSKKCKFINAGETIYLPVAHGEGKFIPRDDGTFRQLQANDQIVFRYVDKQGNPGGPFPINPNGSVDDIAGICDPSGKIFGLMPHPERHIDVTQNPHWTTRQGKQKPGGIKIFEKAVKYFG